MVDLLLDLEGVSGVTIAVDRIEAPGTLTVRTKTGQLSEHLHMAALLAEAQHGLVSKMYTTLQAAKQAELIRRFEKGNDDGE